MRLQIEVDDATGVITDAKFKPLVVDQQLLLLLWLQNG